uniref:Post-segregation antitoxin CcdA n=1 Tax=Geobacter sp. (strain M21) TaxID=443144 RepID=C6E6E4_GEOSM
MENALFDATAPKKSTNLSINSDLLRLARERHINLSQALESRLEEMLRQEARRSWQEENREAIEEYNRRVQSDGTFSDDLRHF